MYKIQSNVPYPAYNRAKTGAPARYPFYEMKPGDSFVIPNDPVRVNRLKAAVNYHRARHPRWRFRWSYVDGGEGFRVWRTPDEDPPTLRERPVLPLFKRP